MGFSNFNMSTDHLDLVQLQIFFSVDLGGAEDYASPFVKAYVVGPWTTLGRPHLE